LQVSAWHRGQRVAVVGRRGRDRGGCVHGLAAGEGRAGPRGQSWCSWRRPARAQNGRNGIRTFSKRRYIWWLVQPKTS